MSHWDFGRPADGQHDAPRRSGPAGATYSPDLPDGAEGEAPDRDEWNAAGGWPARDGWPADSSQPARDTWPAHEGWAPAEGWPAPGDVPANADWPAEDNWEQADEGWDDGEYEAPYPLTYERDDFAVSDPSPPAPPPRQPTPPCRQPVRGNRGRRRPAQTGTRTRAAQTTTTAMACRRPAAGTACPGTGDVAQRRRPADGRARDPGLPSDDPADWTARGNRRGGPPLAAAGRRHSRGCRGGRRRRACSPAVTRTPRAIRGLAARSRHQRRQASRGARRSARSTPGGAASSAPAAGPLTMTQAKAVLAALHDGKQRRERAAQRHDARHGRDRVQFRDRRGPVPGAAGGGDDALPGVRTGSGDVLRSAR